jgi:hypothetical protein
MAEITIAELVRNGTMSAEMAAVLWAAADEQASFLTVALPRLAGKSTTSEAVLALRPEGVPLHNVAGEPGEMERLQRERLGGYLVVAEFSQAPIPGYIWGEPVRRVFETVRTGYSLQTSLHAESAEEGMLAVTRGNGISDADASTFKLVLYIERFGTDMSNYWRRLVDLYEVDRVENGLPVGRSLFKWIDGADQFVQTAEPVQFGRDDLAGRAEVIGRLAQEGRTSAADVMTAVRDYHKTRVT